MKIAIDAMGGDHAPEQVVLGVIQATKAFPDLEFILVGDEGRIRPILGSSESAAISIIHTEAIIEATDEPVRAVRRKKNASMVLMANEVKEGRADACISAGNTGALMASGLFVVGRIDGIERPALAPTLPTINGQGFVFLDVGANAEARPEHLLQFAIMGSVYAENVRKITKPRVGLLNVGTEEKKGSELTKQAFTLLKDAPIHFVGNVEARDLLEGVADVVVTDGFTGNVALKTIEGTAMGIFSMLKKELTSTLTSKLATAVIKPQLMNLKNNLDYSEYGGAGLFGLNAPVIKAHGSSDAKAVLNAIRQAKDMVEKNVIDTISTTITKK